MTLQYPYSKEQEAIWAKEKAECLERYYETTVEQCVKWLEEVKHSPQRRAKRIEEIRKKLGKEVLRRTLRKIRERDDER